ncbi:MAG: hypothetical protein J6X54_02665 [Treponema sp.]|nr:hypothetical protein [Treponema sp.]
MKRRIIFLSCLAVMCAALFGQNVPRSDNGKTDEEIESQKLKTEVIIPKDQHLYDETASVKIEYMPLYDEVRIYYECMYVTYERGEAMNTILECLADFQKEHKYYNYRYLTDDRERFFKDDNGRRKAMLISYVKFTR